MNLVLCSLYLAVLHRIRYSQRPKTQDLFTNGPNSHHLAHRWNRSGVADLRRQDRIALGGASRNCGSYPAVGFSRRNVVVAQTTLNST
jgi:hypothetical protein